MNGSCLNGCDVGVYGDKCDIGMLKNLLIFLWVFFKRKKYGREKHVIEIPFTLYVKKKKTYTYVILKKISSSRHKT